MNALPHKHFNIPKQLDEMLEWFCEPLQWRKSHTIEVIFKSIIDRNKELIQLNIDASGILNACLNKLRKDGYIAKVKKEVYDMDSDVSDFHDEYRITYDGLLFNQIGGYKDLRDREDKKELLRLWERIALAIGAVMAGSYGLFQMILYFVQSKYQQAVLNGMVVGIYIGLSIWLSAQLLIGFRKQTKVADKTNRY